MTPCFGDTSYYLAALIPQDINHDKARRLAATLRRTVMTSEFVLLEVGNYLSASKARGKFGPFLRSVRGDTHTTIVPASSALLSRGFDLYDDRPDKDWSVTDCISFALMRDHSIADALTADRHFEQAGFNLLLR